MTRCGQSRVRAVLVSLAAVALVPVTVAGPVLVYRSECPRERPPDAPRITAEQAIEIAKPLLPRDFCGPNGWVSGCLFDPEWAFDTWRVFAQQYKLADGVKDTRGRDHSYIVLDAVGNCIANIPGT